MYVSVRCIVGIMKMGQAQTYSYSCNIFNLHNVLNFCFFSELFYYIYLPNLGFTKIDKECSKISTRQLLIALLLMNVTINETFASQKHTTPKIIGWGC